MRWLPLLIPVVIFSASCPRPPDEPPQKRDGPDVIWCPGSEGCTAKGEAQLKAGAGKRVVTPRGFEIANIHYLRGRGCDPVMMQRWGMDHCGELNDDFIDDCGTDAVCPRDDGYTAPDADGSEGDGKDDWFLDCGLDRLCPGNVPESGAEASDGIDNDGDGAIDDGAYTGPDADGTEGDHIFQAAWMAGFGNNRPAMGVHDDQEVRCIAMEAGETRVVMCTVDAVGYFYDEVKRIRQLFKERHPELAVDYLEVSGTHSHEETDTLGQWGRADPIPLKTGRLDGHNAFINDMAVEAAADAVRALEPAKMRVASTNTGGPNFIHDGTDPQIIDDTLTMFEAVGDDGNPIFTALHWGNHPEDLGDDNSLLSADYVHALREALEKGLPATATSPAHAPRGGMGIYINGSVGGIMGCDMDFVARDGTLVPRRPRGFARNTAYGEHLAETGLALLEDASKVTEFSRGEMVVKARKLHIPVRNRAFAFAFQTGLFDRALLDENNALLDLNEVDFFAQDVFLETEAWTLDVGPMSFTGVPGELFPEVAIGGYDGSKTLGYTFINPDFCPPQSACDMRNNCPSTKPEGGWTDCGCEACRLCTPPDVAHAPAGPYLKERMPGQFRMMVGLSNDEIGYLVPPHHFKLSEFDPYLCEAKDHYEETNSVGPDAVPEVVEAVHALYDFKP